MIQYPLSENLSFGGMTEEIKTLVAGKPAPEKSLPELQAILSLMDLTSLEGSDNPEKITALCRKALSLGEKGLAFPAAVCIYPPFIALARKILAGSPVKVATTAAAFPSGQMSLPVKLEEIRYAVGEGADEVDVVISRGTFLAGDHQVVYDELAAMRELTKEQTLKVILETGELQTPENIARASELAIRAGADFIKTSTGKISPAATPESMWVMLRVIDAHFRATGKRVGIKPAGGIADPAQALIYYHLVSSLPGGAWLTPALFRLGASRLADRIVEKLTQV